MSRRLRLLTAGALGMLILAGLTFAPASVAGASGAVKWWTLETEHFFIHFRSGYGDAAREVALYAEKAYATQWVSPSRCCAAAQLPSQRPSSGSI